MAHLKYILKRVVQVIPVLIIVSILIFLLVRLIPGDPARILLGDQALESEVQALRVKMGLDKPYMYQYLVFLKNIVTLQLGYSLVYQIPVKELLATRIPVTITLTLIATSIALIISFPLGYIAGNNKDRLGDQVIRITALAAISIPSFWIGLLLMMFFGVKLSWFPVGGWGDTWPQHIRSLILPGITQALLASAILMRNLRNSVVDINTLDYVDFANSKGLRDRTVRNRYVLKNALISTVTLLFMRMAYMLGGSVIIESVFSLPGIGKLMVDAIFGRDYIVVQSLVFLFAFIVLLINLLTDIIYAYIDPRVKL